MKTLRKLCILVREHGTGPEGVHRFIRDIAEKLQDAPRRDKSGNSKKCQVGGQHKRTSEFEGNNIYGIIY